MIQKEIDVSVPFNSIKKIYPNGDILIKKFKFTSYKIKKGYELVDERLAHHVIDKNKDFIFKSDFISDWEDRRYRNLLNIQRSISNNFDIAEIKNMDFCSKPLFIKEGIDVADEEKKRKKILYNIAKTRNKIFDIARSNDFNYFITLTYNSQSCDRYSFSDCSSKIRKFMNNFKNEHKFDCPNFKYLLVHEQHKDGAYHYHGLIYLENADLLQLAGRQPKNCKQIVYNWSRWKNGFSTATEIQNQEATRKYILKYINKNIDENYQKGQRHFYYSQNCLKPQIESMISNPQMLMLYNQIYDTDRSTGYESTIDLQNEMLNSIMKSRYGIEGDLYD